ncbi:MAG TPA: LamG-like jellyroll fold domain-containing protein, partial [Verrucomicrobiae bacterium]|nr:LamG-like jellyroll fold domain-containing protein [Verrucomicrobiae bacterium]
IDVGGTPSLSYAWRKNGSAIAGASTSAFTIANLKSTDSATYDVVVTNNFGIVTSSQAVIAVQTPTKPVITQGPTGRTLYQGGMLDLTVAATGGQLQYQWQQGGSNVAGATTSAYIVPSVAGKDAGTYQVAVSNSLGVATAGPVTVNVIVPAANTYEATIVNDTPEAWWRLDEPVGSTVMMDAMGRHDGTYVGTGVTLGAPGVVSHGAADTAVSFDGSESFGDVPYSAALNNSDFSLEAWALLTDDTVARSIVSTYDTSAHKGIFFKANPDGTYESDVGENDQYIWYFAPMGNISNGRWAHFVSTFDSTSGQNINYLNGKLISGPFGDFVRNGKFDFLIGAVGTNFQGIARWKGTIDEVAVYKYALTATQIQAHYVAALYGTNTAPVFLSQPQPVTVAVGDPASFSAQVEGSLPITFQWFKNGVAIPNATNATLSFGKTALIDTGTYQLTASNFTSSNSSPVSLTVLPPITFANATNGLVMHLKFDGDYSDATGRGNNGTAVGTPTFVPGQIGQALHYSTTTDTGASGGTVTNANYVTLGKPADLQFGATTPFSVAFWVRLPTNYLGGDLPFFGSAVNSANNQGFTFCPSYQLGGWQWDIEQITSTATNNVDVNGPDGSINDGAWHHFAVTFDRDNAVALTYLDGAQVNSSAIGAVGAFDSTNSISIGQDPTGLYPESGSASLDDLGVWHRVLGPLEVYEIYYSGLHFGSPLDAYGPPSGQVSLAVGILGTNPVISWSGGTLVQSDTPSGPWTPVPGASPPTYQITPSAGAKFYRIKL